MRLKESFEVQFKVVMIIKVFLAQMIAKRAGTDDNPMVSSLVNTMNGVRPASLIPLAFDR
jgi:NAD/NADP transhydrogenase beta subunit